MNQEPDGELGGSLTDLADLFKNLLDLLTEAFYAFIDQVKILADSFRMYFKTVFRLNLLAIERVLWLCRFRPQGPRNPLPHARLKNLVKRLPESVVRAVSCRVNFEGVSR